MQRIGIALAVLITLLLVACGGGGGTPTPTEVPADQAEPINILVRTDGIEPNQVEIESGKPYKFVVTNQHETQSRALLAPRWRITVGVPPGGTEESDPFSEGTPGNYKIHERTRGIKPAYQCMVVVK